MKDKKINHEKNSNAMKKNGPNKSKHSLVVGCGALGMPLGLSLKHQGYQVSTISRSQRSHYDLTHLCRDVTKPFVLEQSFDLVYYIISASQYSQQGYQDAYVTGLQNTLNALRPLSESCRVIYISSSSVYEESEGGWVTESSALTEDSQSPSFQIVLGETLLRSANFEYSIVRFSGLYGRGRRSLLDRVLDNQRSRTSPSRISNRIHQDDALGVLTHLADISGIATTYLASDSLPSDSHEIIAWLETQVHTPKNKIETDEGSQERRKVGSKCCSNRRLLDSGYQFIYPSYREGFAAEIAERGLSLSSHSQEES